MKDHQLKARAGSVVTMLEKGKPLHECADFTLQGLRRRPKTLAALCLRIAGAASDRAALYAETPDAPRVDIMARVAGLADCLAAMGRMTEF